MGLTVLGIGNALPDALTTIALAKEGISIYIYILIEYIQYIYIYININRIYLYIYNRVIYL